MGLKLIPTRPAKQFSGYALVMQDMQYASRVFGLAAKQPSRTAREINEAGPSAEEHVRGIFAFDQILRAGGAVASMGVDKRNDSEIVQAALFESGVITYGRCFTSGQRTQLKVEIFRGPLASAKQVHEALMKIRHKHVAHSELKMERSIVGGGLVDDPNYGKRPSANLNVLALRRNVPPNERLLELQAHCEAIVEHVIYPKFLEAGKSVREHLLTLPPAQIDEYLDFADAPTDVDDLI